MKHKWHDEIVAWAGGAEIEFLNQQGIWCKMIEPPTWMGIDYRIKPQDICKCQKQACPALKEKKYLNVWRVNGAIRLCGNGDIIEVPRSTTSIYKIGKIEVQDV